MYLIAGSTEPEISKLRENEELAENFDFLVTGIGVLESAISLLKYFSARKADWVVLFGLCGAYPGTGTDILDVCLAEAEHFGDFGIAINDEIEYFSDPVFENRYDFDLKNNFFARIENSLEVLKIPYKKGPFVTVNSCSGTLSRGSFLRDEFGAICENMEGAAIAHVCRIHNVPMTEVRCVSNLVEDRDKTKWQISKAIAEGSDVIAKILIEAVK